MSLHIPPQWSPTVLKKTFLPSPDYHVIKALPHTPKMHYLATFPPAILTKPNSQPGRRYNLVLLLNFKLLFYPHHREFWRRAFSGSQSSAVITLHFFCTWGLQSVTPDIVFAYNATFLVFHHGHYKGYVLYLLYYILLRILRIFLISAFPGATRSRIRKWRGWRRPRQRGPF